jgi:serine/threonine-protein kinase RsbW
MQAISTIELPAGLDHLYKFMDVAASFASRQGFNDKILKDIELCLEEALVNVFNYAYENAAGSVGVECSFEGGKLMIKVTDSGKPFNPIAEKTSDIHTNMVNDRIGGYGIILIKKLTDDVRYVRENDKNVLTLIFNRYKD